MVYTQSRVQRLASFELLAVTNLKATGISSEAIESIRRPTSFFNSKYLFPRNMVLPHLHVPLCIQLLISPSNILVPFPYLAYSF